MLRPKNFRWCRAVDDFSWVAIQSSGSLNRAAGVKGLWPDLQAECHVLWKPLPLPPGPQHPQERYVLCMGHCQPLALPNLHANSHSAVPGALANMAEQKLIQQEPLSRLSRTLHVHSQAGVGSVAAGLLQ